MTTPTTLPHRLIDSGLPDRWPAILATTEGLWERVEAELSGLPESVAEAFRDRLSSGDRAGPAWVRVALCTLGLCRVDGAAPEEVLASGLIRMRSPMGPFVVAPLPFRLSHLGPGDRDALDRLVAALAGLPFHVRYTLHLKAPLPEGVDVQPIARAVGLWLVSVRGGDQQGTCASYIDGDIALEICLTALDRGDNEPAMLSVVTPKRSLHALAEIDTRIMHAVQEADAVEDGGPLLIVLGGDKAWPVTRGFAHQVLYGTAREVVATVSRDEPRYEALYLSNGLSLFSDPLCRALSDIWWLQPGSETLSATAWSSENPWADEAPAVPRLAGRRFARREGPVGPDRATVMAWTSDTPAHWSLP